MQPNYQTKRRQVEALHVTAADEKTFAAIREFFGGPDQAIVRTYPTSSTEPGCVQISTFGADSSYFVLLGEWLVRIPAEEPQKARVLQVSDEYFNQSYEPIPPPSRSLCDTEPEDRGE